jgi:hypothetical protein
MRQRYPNTLSERIGRALNALDIDFSRFTAAGWIVSLVSLAAGVLTGLTVYEAIPQFDAKDQGRALVLGISVIVATTVTFLVSKAILARLGIPIVKPLK